MANLFKCGGALPINHHMLIASGSTGGGTTSYNLNSNLSKESYCLIFASINNGYSPTITFSGSYDNVTFETIPTTVTKTQGSLLTCGAINNTKKYKHYRAHYTQQGGIASPCSIIVVTF